MCLLRALAPVIDNLLLRLSLGVDEDDVEEKVGPTIRYLQKLNDTYLDLIFKSSRWVFDANPTNALEVGGRPIQGSWNLILSPQIFTAEEAQLPRSAVIDYLEKIDPMVCARYIEFLISEQKCTDTAFHNRLAELYLDVVIRSTKKSEQGVFHHDVSRAILITMVLSKAKGSLRQIAPIHQCVRALPS